MSEVVRYTPAQTRWFLRAIDRAERRARRARLHDLRAAEIGPEDFKRYLRTLG